MNSDAHDKFGRVLELLERVVIDITRLRLHLKAVGFEGLANQLLPPLSNAKIGYSLLEEATGQAVAAYVQQVDQASHNTLAAAIAGVTAGSKMEALDEPGSRAK